MNLNSDHRNSSSRQMPAAGATTGIPFHGKCPPQARPAESLFTAILTVGGGRPMVAPTFRSYSRFVQFPRPKGKHCPFAGEKREGYGENVVIVIPSSERARCCVNRICYCACAHAFGMGAPHLPLARSPFPSQHCGLRSSAEGFVAHQNFMLT